MSKDGWLWLLLICVHLMIREKYSLIVVVCDHLSKCVFGIVTNPQKMLCLDLQVLIILFCSFFLAGLDLLIGLLGSTNPKQQLDGAVALYKLANKAMTLSPVDAAPPSPISQVSFYTGLWPVSSLVFVYCLYCQGMSFVNES